jgi:hypothetical protein
LVARFLKHTDTPIHSFEEMILRISKEAEVAISKIDKKILAWIAVNPNGTHKECGKRYRLKANVVRVRLQRIASKPAVIDAIWDYKPLRQLILARPKAKQNSIVTSPREWDTIDDDGEEGWITLADTHAFAMWSSEDPAENPKPNIAEICKKDPRTPLADDEWDRQFQASTDIAYQELRTEVMNMDDNTLRPPRSYQRGDNTLRSKTSPMRTG